MQYFMVLFWTLQLYMMMLKMHCCGAVVGPTHQPKVSVFDEPGNRLNVLQSTSLITVQNVYACVSQWFPLWR